MKKVAAIMMALLLVLTLFSGCAGSGKAEIALITDKGNIDDKSFNQGSWKA